MRAAKVSARLLGVKVECWRFNLAEMKDDQGMQLRLRIAYHDLEQVQQWTLESSPYQEFIPKEQLPDRLPMFLAKSLIGGSPLDRDSMWRALILVQACAWQSRTSRTRSGELVLFLETLTWFSPVARYGRLNDVTVKSVRPAQNLRATVRSKIPSRIVDVLRKIKYRGLVSPESLSEIKKRFFDHLARKTEIEQPEGLKSNVSESSAQLAIEYIGQLNLDHPELHSDLFFWQKSSLPGKNIMVTCSSPSYPFDQQAWDEFQKHDIKAVALHPGAATVPAVPLFSSKQKPPWDLSNTPGIRRRGKPLQWLKAQANHYHEVKAYWSEVFAANNIKVFVTYYKYDALHMAIGDAIKDLDGVSAIHQRAFEGSPSPETTIAADIVFGFSRLAAEVERNNHSFIPYHVVTGYLGDHRFPLHRTSALETKNRLRQNGAQHILAYFDENSADDSRWLMGHSVTQNYHAFLLEKVLSEPWFGLLLKPKTPRTLRQRLGPVAQLLDRAIATGRCYIYEAGGDQAWYPPVSAALAADIALHGHLYSATAGMESALAGVPTLLLDQDGWSNNPLYQLGVGRVVFTDWDQLWEACLGHWNQTKGTPGFGDWSPLLSELDPFRDGKAAERMGTYLNWLLQGFEQGLEREAVMSNAAELYCARWGQDKVTSINCGPQVGLGVQSTRAQPNTRPTLV